MIGIKIKAAMGDADEGDPRTTRNASQHGAQGLDIASVFDGGGDGIAGQVF